MKDEEDNEEKKVVYDVHHRLCKSNTRNHQGGYPITVKQKFHRHWHAVFQDRDAYGIAEVCNKMINPEYKLIVVRRKSNDGKRQKTHAGVKKTSGRNRPH